MREKFDLFLQNMATLSPEMLPVTRLFLTNAQGGPLLEMKITPTLSQSCQVLSMIVVHSVSVLLNRKNYSILQPFVDMMSNAAALQARCSVLLLLLLLLLFHSFCTFPRMLTFQLCLMTYLKESEKLVETFMVC